MSSAGRGKSAAQSRTAASPPAKVFGLGLSKTGTSSLRVALQQLGYSVAPPNKALLRRLRSGDPQALLDFTAHYDAFQDFPYPLAFREIFATYGTGAKYVLTRRSSPEHWYRSLCDHARTSRLMSGQWLSYGYYRPFGREAAYIDFYRTHNRSVRQFFRDRGAEDSLLEVCWDDGDGWDVLCPFLGVPVPDADFPHANKSAETNFRGRRAINRLIEGLYLRLIG